MGSASQAAVKVLRVLIENVGGSLIIAPVLWVGVSIYFVFNPPLFPPLKFHGPTRTMELTCPTFRTRDQQKEITAAIPNIGAEADFQIEVSIYDKRWQTGETLCTETVHLMPDEVFNLQCTVTREQIEQNTYGINAVALSSEDELHQGKPNSYKGDCGIIIDPVQRLLLPSLVAIYVMLIGVAMVTAVRQ